MNLEEIKSQVLMELGHPVVDVEIDETQWCGVEKSTKRWFNARKGLIGFEIIPIYQNQREYDFPLNAESVLDVYLPFGMTDIQGLFSQGILETDLVPADVFRSNRTTGFSVSASAYLQLLNSLETKKKIFSAEPTWEIMGRKIIVTGGINTSYNTPTGRSMLVSYRQKDFNIEDLLDHRDIDLFYRYFLARSKILLGRIRSKYKSYPSAGGTIDSDGPELLEEGKAEIELIEEEISNSQFPMGLLVG